MQTLFFPPWDFFFFFSSYSFKSYSNQEVPVTLFAQRANPLTWRHFNSVSDGNFGGQLFQLRVMILSGILIGKLFGFPSVQLYPNHFLD